MMLLPIGHDAGVKRIPYVTFSLLGLNILIHLFTSFIAPAREESFWAAKEEYEYFYNWKYNEHAIEIEKELQLVEKKVPVIERVRIVQDEIKKRLNNRTLRGMEEQDYAEWERLKNKYEAAQSKLIYYRFGFVPGDLKWYAIFTSMFLHVNFFHLFGNMLILYLAGCAIEDRWGAIVFGIFYIIAGVVAGFTQAASNWESLIPCIGASGAIAGLMGAFLIRFRNVRIRFFYFYFFFGFTPRTGIFAAPAMVMLPLWFLIQVFFTFFGLSLGVAYLAHIGGFVFGAVVAFIIYKFGLEMTLQALTDDIGAVNFQHSPHLTEAHQLYDLGNINEAVAKYRKALEEQPDSYEAHKGLFTGFLQMQNPRAAIAHGEWLVRYYRQHKMFAEVIEIYAEFRNVYPDMYMGPFMQLSIAKSLELLGDWEGAITLYNEVVKMDPDNHQKNKAIYQKAQIFSKYLGKPQKALLLYELLRAKDGSGTWKEVVEQEIQKLSK